jgi:nicotinate-nucleotide adenylyltransferase
MRKIGLLTGTFDPVHLGHVALAQAAMRACSLDEVWFLVNPDPEHKNTLTPYVDRLAMVELAIVGVAGLRVYSGPQARAPHVIATFKAIGRAHPDCNFVYVLGVDTFVRLDRWQDVQSVVSNASYAIAFRSGTPDQALVDLRARLGGLADRLETKRFEFDDHGMASSTDIRRQIAAGERPPSLSEKVYEYVVKRGIYGAV